MSENNPNIFIAVRPALANKLGILFLSFLVMLFVIGSLQLGINHVITNVRAAFLTGSAMQSLLMFIVPSSLVARLCAASPSRYLGLSEPAPARRFAGVVILLICLTPAMNAIIEWNASMHLPDAMAGVESLLREWEDNAAKATEMLLSDTSLGGLISGVLVIGCLTGFAEECFFRGGVQKALTSSGVNVHLSVWLTAFLFSAVHFQFFGFIPRMLLGALFGYLYFYSGSLWVSAFAHAVNNSIVVVSAWLAGRGLVSGDVDSLGVGGGDSLFIMLGSVMVTAGLLIAGGRYFFSNKFHPLR